MNFLPLHPYFLPISTNCLCPTVIPTCPPTSTTRSSTYTNTNSRGLFIGNHEAAIFKELFKLSKWLVEYRGRFLARFYPHFWAPFLPLFWAVGVRGFACISTFPGFEVPFLACFRRVFEHTFGRCFEQSGAPSEYEKIACILSLANRCRRPSLPGNPLAKRPKDWPGEGDDACLPDGLPID